MAYANTMQENALTASRPFVPLFLYWGRRGLSRWTLDLMSCAAKEPGLDFAVSVSRFNELFAQFETGLNGHLITIDTFSGSAGGLAQAWRIPSLRRHFVSALKARGVTHVVDLMPHLWMPFVLPSIKRAGIRYIPIIHDATVHPGDFRTLAAKMSTNKSVAMADHIVTLSQAVAGQLRATSAIPEDRLSVLFLPGQTFSTSSDAPRAFHSPPRVLFLGRVMPYKGLSLFIDTVEELRGNGFSVACGVFGEGNIDKYRARLSALDAEVVNHWLSEDEIANVLSRYDVLIASHVEASQSGVVASALSAGLPAIVTPVGGLREQIQDGKSGLVSEAVSATALGRSIRSLFSTPGLYESVCHNISASAENRSMPLFLRSLLRVVRAADEIED